MWMAEARSREAWNHTAQIMALTANVHRDPKSPVVQPSAFHPFARRNAPRPTMADLKEMTGGK